MSVDQYQRSINSLDKDIAALEKKKSDADKKIADLQSKVVSSQKSITKNTSASTLASKARQISSWNSEQAKQSAESADLGKKISDKRKKRNEEYLKLQKAQQEEQKRQSKEMKRLQGSYESRINEFTKLASLPVVSTVDNATERDVAEKFDVFVSHAWEDKESFVDEFVQTLRDLDIKVWYDKSQIKWGDSMRARIDEGLRKSKFGVAVLSPYYISEGKYWTKAELDGLFQLESINGKALLPIWHNLTKKEVMAYSPIIASKLAMTTATMTPQEIAQELSTLLSGVNAEG